MTETELIRKLTRNIPRRKKELRLGIGDDASILRIGKKDIVVSCDSLVENVHFKRRWGPWRLWGAKAAGAALSDIAAMGARPRFAWSALSLPADMKPAHVQSFYRGFQKRMRRFHTVIAGGNISRSPKYFSATTTVWGEAAAGKAMRRDRAKPKEKVYLSGRLGKSPSRPEPRIQLGQWLLSKGCASAIDVSDGLLQDLHRIAEASRVKIILRAEKIPHRGPLKKALTRGEDYELAFTAKKLPPGKNFREIGEVLAGKPSVAVVNKQGKVLPFSKFGFQHKIG